MRAPFSKAGLSEEHLENFRHELRDHPGPVVLSASLADAGFLAVSRRCRWASARSTPSTRRASCATWRIAASFPKTPRKVWAFLGDGETDEPESLGALTLASREKLDNLIFVVNCNLQRLDGPVRGNGKIIQELEAAFRGAGWNVIKVIWGADWDELLARDKSGLLIKRMEECVDGEYQIFKAKGGAYIRKEFFGKYPELLKLVEHMSDEQIWSLRRGGHDPQKGLQRLQGAPCEHKGQPTVILAKTVKGYGLGEAAKARNATHQQKKLSDARSVKLFRQRFDIPLPDETWPATSISTARRTTVPEMAYLHERRRELGRLRAGAQGAADRDQGAAARDFRTKSLGGSQAAASLPPPWPSCAC